VPASAPAQRDPVLRSAALAPVLAACLMLAVGSLLLSSTPTYDPWAWLIWGREIAGLELDTRGGPSWKPLPVVFTTLFAPAGDLAPALWVAVARAGALLAVAMAYRLGGRVAGRLGGVGAATALLLSDNWIRNAALGSSEGMLVALVLWSVERHLDGRPQQAFALGVGAGLLRPEVWPFLGLYALWLFWRRPRARPLVTGGLLLLPVLWFAPELWGSGDALRASTRANTPNRDSPAFADYPALAVVIRATWLLLPPFLVLFLGGTAWAAREWLTSRREGVTLALGTGALAWVALVALMTEGGYSGNQRYLVVFSGLGAVVAGGALARLVHAARAPRRGAALAFAVVLGLGTLPVIPWAAGKQLEDLRTVRYEKALDQDLDAAVARAGGRRAALRCGQPYTGPFQVPTVAWRLGLPVGGVDYIPRAPGVVFRTRPIRGTRTAPTIPPPGEPFRFAGAAGSWDVFVACPPAAPGARANARPAAVERPARP
jgi:hypothetical protein